MAIKKKSQTLEEAIICHDFGSPKGKTWGYLLEIDMSIFLNITIHFLPQSQKVSLQLFFFNLWVNYCSHLWGVRNTMALITF